MIKPILFNTEMVKAILEGRKTVTRRIVKSKEEIVSIDNFITPLGTVSAKVNTKLFDGCKILKVPFVMGDNLYVRETFSKIQDFSFINDPYFEIPKDLKYLYKCDDNGVKHSIIEAGVNKWRPSLHMPKEAARIFLKVTSVRVERLQDITEEQASAEGVSWLDDSCYSNNGWIPTFYDPDSGGSPIFVDGFQTLWNSTVKKQDLDRYEWDANPFVWVIEFERCEKPND